MNLFDPAALEFLPARHDLSSLRDAAKKCRGCDLYREATRVVFGEGRAPAAILLMQEQLGDVRQHCEAFQTGTAQDLKVAAEYAAARRR